MTIQEAIKSRKPFSRKRFSVSFRWDLATGYLLRLNEGDIFTDGLNVLTIEDVLADDWQLEEKKIEITKTQLADCWNHWIAGEYDCFERSGDSLVFKQLAEALGFDA